MIIIWADQSRACLEKGEEKFDILKLIPTQNRTGEGSKTWYSTQIVHYKEVRLHIIVQNSNEAIS